MCAEQYSALRAIPIYNNVVFVDMAGFDCAGAICAKCVKLKQASSNGHFDKSLIAAHWDELEMSIASDWAAAVPCASYSITRLQNLVWQVVLTCGFVAARQGPFAGNLVTLHCCYFSGYPFQHQQEAHQQLPKLL